MSGEFSSGEQPQDALLAELATVLDSAAASSEIEAGFQAQFCVEVHKNLLSIFQECFGPIGETGYRTGLVFAVFALYEGYVDTLKGNETAVDEAAQKALVLIGSYFHTDSRAFIRDMCAKAITDKISDLH